MFYTYKWQPQPYIETKPCQIKLATTIKSRPSTNGIWILTQPNGRQNNDINVFKSRPIKHWRKQLIADPIRKGTRNITISDIETPNTTQRISDENVNPNDNLINHCDLNEIIGNVKLKNDTKLTNNIGCCDLQKNIIKSYVVPIYKNYTNYNQYFQSNCNGYMQGLSVNKIQNNSYFDNLGHILYPTENKIGSRSFVKSQCMTNNLCNKKFNIIKPKNNQYMIQGAVPQKNRLSNLKTQTITGGNSFYNSASGIKEINFGACCTNTNYYIKSNDVKNINC